MQQFPVLLHRRELLLHDYKQLISVTNAFIEVWPFNSSNEKTLYKLGA